MHGSGLQTGASSGPCGEDGAVHTGSDRGQNGDTAESGLTQLTANETVYSSGQLNTNRKNTGIKVKTNKDLNVTSH